MAPIPTISNLNARLSAKAGPPREATLRGRRSQRQARQARHSSPSSRYRGGGYCVSV